MLSSVSWVLFGTDVSPCDSMAHFYCKKKKKCIETGMWGRAGVSEKGMASSRNSGSEPKLLPIEPTRKEKLLGET